MKNRFVSEEVINPLVDPQLSYEHLETLFEIQQALQHGGFRETMLAQESAESIGVTFTEEGLIETIWNGIRAFFKAIADFFRKLFGMKSKQEANFEKAMKIAEDLEHTGITKVQPGEICSANREAIRKEVSGKLAAEFAADAQAVAKELDKLTTEFDYNLRMLIGLQRLGLFPGHGRQRTFEANSFFEVFFDDGALSPSRGLKNIADTLKYYRDDYVHFEVAVSSGDVNKIIAIGSDSVYFGDNFSKFLKRIHDAAGVAMPKYLSGLDPNILTTACECIMHKQALNFETPKVSDIETAHENSKKFRTEFTRNREIKATLDRFSTFDIKPAPGRPYGDQFAEHLKTLGKGVRIYFAFLEACDRLETKAGEAFDTYLSIAVMLEMVRK